MSSSDSDDFEGFESAEEDVVVSDLDEDELEKILAEDDPSEQTNVQDIGLIRNPIEKINHTTEASNQKSRTPSASHDVKTKPDSQRSSTETSESTEIQNKNVSSNLDLWEKKPDTSLKIGDGNNTKQEHGNYSMERNANSDYLSTGNHAILENRPDDGLTQSSKQIKKEDNKSVSNVSNLNGWDFEDDDIDLPINPVNESPSPSSAFMLTESKPLQPKDDPSGMEVGGDSNPSGWDFEESFELPDSPEKKKDHNTDQLFNKTQNSDSSAIWASWGNWGVTNLITSAAEGVSATSWSHVTSGLTGLTSMLENTLGAPDPEVLASQLSTNEETNKLSPSQDKQIEQSSAEVTDLFGIGSLIGGVKNLGNKVIDGGLGTLETLGKKTMEVLQEGDPGLKKKRALLFQTEKVILSQVLRDAKEKAEASEKEHSMAPRKVQYETLFDDFHGLVHLEALEMISRQCEIKLQSLSSDNPKCSLQEFNETVNMVKSLYDQNDSRNEDDETETVNNRLSDVLDSCMNILSLNVNVKNFIEVDESIQLHLSQSFSDGTEIHTKAISDLAQFTACGIELFHRIAELFIVKELSNIPNDFQALSRIASVSKSKIGTISESYSGKLMLLPDKSNSPLITNIFLEASNSSTYLDNAFELFAPIIQLKALQNDIRT